MDPAPVLALLGDRYHNADYQRVNFNRLFGELDIAFDYTINYEWFSDRDATARLLEGRRLFILARDGYVFPDGYVGPEAYGHYVTQLMDGVPGGKPDTWVTDGFGQAVSDFVEAGGSLFVWHNALHTSLYSPALRALTGGAYDGHPAERPWKVAVLNHSHPVTEGVNDFLLTDEQHFPLCDRPEGDALLQGINVDGLAFTSDSGAVQNGTVSATAWAFERGAGRVLMSAVGHNLYALWRPDYWVFQCNAIRWLLREV